jgi:hypothetical protein
MEDAESLTGNHHGVNDSDSDDTHHEGGGLNNILNKPKQLK